jgi:hypothetical protein
MAPPVSAELETYLSDGMRKVEGWLNPFSARAIATLATAQPRPGALGEIGVHHGKLFIVLALCAAPEERLFAIDVFGKASLNLDRSGAGDERRFRANVKLWAGREDVVVLTDSSLDVRAETVRAACGPARFISIDAGHTAECTQNDLRLAEALLRADGIAVLDDFFNGNWPGVATGGARYFAGAPDGLAPFAITPNKVFLARRPAAPAHRAALRAGLGAHLDKESEMFGAPVDIYQPGRQAVRNALKASPAWPLMRPFARGAWKLLRPRP